MKLKMLLMLVVVLAVAGGAVFFFMRNADEESAGPGAVKNRTMLIQKSDPAAASATNARQRVEALIASQTIIPNPKGKKGFVFAGRLSGDNFDGIYRDDDGKPFPQADQEIMTRLDAAFEKDSIAEIRALAEMALASKTPEVRANVVRTLGWYGKKSLVEMTPFLSDKDGEVSELAHDEWMSALQEMDEDSSKAAVIEMTLRALSDKDMIEDVAGELVGLDELAAIQVIVNIMETGGSAVPYVAEVYDTITGDEWTSIDDAEAWLQENYADEDGMFESDDAQDSDDVQESYDSQESYDVNEPAQPAADGSAAEGSAPHRIE